MSAPTTMPPPPPSPCEKVLTMTIGSYSEAKKLANGCFVKSSPADVGGHSWRIAFYPNGNLAGTTKSMSLFLLLDDAKGHGQGSTAVAEEDVRVKYKFIMRDVTDGTLTFMSGEVAAAFSRRKRCSHGFERFVSRADFEKSALFRSDRFAIRCDLTVFPAGSHPAVEAPPPPAARSKPSAATAAPPPPSSSPEPSVVRKKTPPPAAAAPPKPSVPSAAAPPSSSPKPSAVTTRTAPPPVPPEPAMAPPSGLHVDLGSLLATKEGADVELEVCGKVFAAHKSVLAARSSVLREEFFGPTKEKNTSYILISEMHCPEAFEALLHYMYTDSLPEMITTMNSLEQGFVVTEDLLIAAESYNMKDLKSLVESKLCSHVGVSTVLLMLALAERYQCSKLKKTCLRFIGSSANTKAVMATNDVENLARSSPSVVKDVITEILDANSREERVRDLFVDGCICALCSLLLFLLFAFLNQQ